MKLLLFYSTARVASFLSSVAERIPRDGVLVLASQVLPFKVIFRRPGIFRPLHSESSVPPNTVSLRNGETYRDKRSRKNDDHQKPPKPKKKRQQQLELSYMQSDRISEDKRKTLRYRAEF